MGMDKNAFNISDEEFLNYLNKISGKKVWGSVGKNFENLPIFDILEKNIDKIPYLPDLNDKNKSKYMWNKIKHIFPEIKNDEDARSEVNFNAIAHYFNDALRFIIIPEILESEKEIKVQKLHL